MQTVLVTGGAGYLGSVLVEQLLRRGLQVTVVDNLMYGPNSLFGYCSQPDFSFVRGDVRDRELMGPLLSRHQTVLPLAAIVGAGPCDADRQTAQAVNLDAIRWMIDQLRPDQRVVFPMTNSGYGTHSGEVYCTEETPLEPISYYGRSKVEAEQAVLSHPQAIALRLATVFGPSPRMRLDLLVNDFVHRAVVDGSLVIYEKDFKRNYIHVSDVADCFCHCIDHFEEMRGETYNVGLDDANLSKEELALTIKEHVPSLYIHFAEIGCDPDKRNYIVSSDKIKSRGFVAQRSLDEGIRQLVQLVRMLPRAAHRNGW